MTYGCDNLSKTNGDGSDKGAKGSWPPPSTPRWLALSAALAGLRPVRVVRIIRVRVLRALAAAAILAHVLGLPLYAPVPSSTDMNAGSR